MGKANPGGELVGHQNRGRGGLLFAASIVLAVGLSGCASVIAIATHEVMTGIGIVSMIATGKGLSDHAMDAMTGQDCRLIGGMVSDQRAVCEPRGSQATAGDFRGVLGYAPAASAPSAPEIDWDTGTIDAYPDARLANYQLPATVYKSADELALTQGISTHGYSKRAGLPGSSYRRIPGTVYRIPGSGRGYSSRPDAEAY